MAAKLAMISPMFHVILVFILLPLASYGSCWRFFSLSLVSMGRFLHLISNRIGLRFFAPVFSARLQDSWSFGLVSNLLPTTGRGGYGVIGFLDRGLTVSRARHGHSYKSPTKKMLFSTRSPSIVLLPQCYSRPPCSCPSCCGR